MHKPKHTTAAERRRNERLSEPDHGRRLFVRKPASSDRWPGCHCNVEKSQALHANTDEYPNPTVHQHADANEHSNTNGHSDRHRNSNQHIDADEHSNVYEYRDPHQHADRHRDCDQHADSNEHADGNQHRDQHADASSAGKHYGL